MRAASGGDDGLRATAQQFAHGVHHFGGAWADDKLMLLTLFDIALHAGQLPEGGQIQALLVADLDAHPRHAVLQFKDITLAPRPPDLCRQCRCLVHRRPHRELTRQRRAQVAVVPLQPLLRLQR